MIRPTRRPSILHPGALLEERRTGALRERMGIAETDADRLDQFGLRNLDDTPGAAADRRERGSIRHTNRQAIREGIRRVRCNDMAGRERTRIRISLASCATTPTIRVVSPSASRIPIIPQMPERRSIQDRAIPCL
jgi:hypothetical protein